MPDHLDLLDKWIEAFVSLTLKPELAIFKNLDEIGEMYFNIANKLVYIKSALECNTLLQSLCYQRKWKKLFYQVSGKVM